MCIKPEVPDSHSVEGKVDTAFWDELEAI